MLPSLWRLTIPADRREQAPFVWRFSGPSRFEVSMYRIRVKVRVDQTDRTFHMRSYNFSNPGTDPTAPAAGLHPRQNHNLGYVGAFRAEEPLHQFDGLVARLLHAIEQPAAPS